ncbi:HNH endonuclease [Larkinella rosea]|uniref:HNH endonuclease n=1 Tax=Larkinella rosea TaxID=2025312 RepID=A0A3P1BC75_9BACT|nr:hypothetical protein [Larkinella rosea]RRA98629.1 hypothetical protein EHT25_26870 [Larkinella rosea]
MLYTYREIDHPIQHLQNQISYYFERLFDLEPNPYDIELVLRPEFIEFIDSSNKFKNYLEGIAVSYVALPDDEKDLVKQAYAHHSNIEQLCNNTAVTVVKYAEVVNEAFRELLKEFLTWLWEGYDKLPQALRDEYGDLQDHFSAFKKQQKGKVCPFCGIQGLKPPTDRKRRNAYDHYIPKATYPFVSINFKNLFPACHECNSDEKSSYDTPYRNGVRQKILFPFDTTYTIDNLTIYIDPKEVFDAASLSTLLSSINWDIAFSIEAGTMDIYDAWDDIFKIKTRYKEYIIDYEDTWVRDFVLGKYREDVMEDGLTFDRYKFKLINGSKKSMFDDDKAILRLIYFNFVFSIADIEDKLKKVLGV